MGKSLKDFEKRLKEFQKEFDDFKKKNRKSPEIGEVIEVAGYEWVVLDKTEKGYYVIMKEFESSSKAFDNSSNHWEKSSLREYLRGSLLKKLEDEIGELPELERNLLSLDGQTEYGTCMDKISLLTVDEYRKFRKYLPNKDKWWWLITPWSTPCNGYSSTVTVVSPSGFISRIGFGNSYGVRPFCIFPSSIFASEEK